MSLGKRSKRDEVEEGERKEEDKAELTSLGAPGPTAMTVASGRGLEVAEVGRKIPEAVF